MPQIVRTIVALLSVKEAHEKVLEDDDELENKDVDIESEEIEDDAFENNNFLAETLKQSLRGLGKDQVNGKMASILSMQVWKCWFHFIT